MCIISQVLVCTFNSKVKLLINETESAKKNKKKHQQQNNEFEEPNSSGEISKYYTHTHTHKKSYKYCSANELFLSHSMSKPLKCNEYRA